MNQGIAKSFADHKRCNAIRSKVHQHAKAVRQGHRQQVLLAAGNMDKKRVKIPTINVPVGGISFEEFHFLQQGLEDRGKYLLLMGIVAVTKQKLNTILYATLLFPKALPSPFYNLILQSFGTGNSETKWERLSRERSQGVLHALLEMEQRAKESPLMSHINFFGRRLRMRRRDQVEDWRRSTANFFIGGGGGGGDASMTMADTRQGDGIVAQTVLDAIRLYIYPQPPPKKKRVNGSQRRLGPVPEEVIHGMARTFFPRSARLMPTFVARSQLAARVQRLADADEFLVRQAQDWGTSLYNVTQRIDPELLHDVCASRLIGGVGRRSTPELAMDLAEWLQETVVRPAQYMQQQAQAQAQAQQAVGTEPPPPPLEYNGVLARATLMAYYAARGVRDDRRYHRNKMSSAPSLSELPADSFFLPDLLFDGDSPQHAVRPQTKKSEGRGKG